MSDESVRADGLKQKRKMRPALKLLLLIGAPLLVLVIGWLALDIVTGWKLEAVLADIRARGWPTEVAELYPTPISDSENAALLYGLAFGKRRAVSDSTAETTKDHSLQEWAALSPEQQAQVRSDLARNASTLDLLHQAAQRPSCDFHLDYRKGYFLELPHLSRLRDSIYLERAAVIVALDDGRTEDAFEYWLDMVAMVRHQEGQRFLITELVRLTCLSIACDTLQGVVQSGQLDAQHVDSALAALDGLESRHSFVGGLQGEVAVFRNLLSPRYVAAVAYELFGGDSLDAVISSGDLRTASQKLFAIAPAKLYESPLGRPWRQYDEATGLGIFRELMQMLEQPYYVKRASVSGPSEKAELPSWSAPATCLVLPAYAHLGSTFAAVEARVACARTALALERYRLTHGQYPATLDALVPDILPQVPLDPFDGKPLRYINDGKRVAVYSVGQNLQDDGGSEEEVGSPHRPKDIVFTLRPARVEEGGEAR